MDVSYCVTGKYPNNIQPPSCYYNSTGDFIAIDYNTPETIRLLNKQFDYDKNGNIITNGPLVKGNITSVRMPPNGWTEFYTNGNCDGQGTLVNGSSNIDDPSQAISCFKVGSSKSWSNYTNDCRAGFGDQTLCQQYAKSNIPPIPPIIPDGPIPVTVVDPGNNRWWIYLVLGILLVLIVIMVLAGVYVASKPSRSDIKTVPPIVITSPQPSPLGGNKGEIVNPTAVNKPTKLAPKIVKPEPPRPSYYRVE